jgi:hypothetical protein
MSFLDFSYGWSASYNGKKTLDFHVLSNLAFITIISYSYDLWMFKGGVDIFALVINFIYES